MKEEREIYVITGGAGSGKTSVIDSLKERGFVVLSDTARELKAQSALDGVSDLDEGNEELFYTKVARAQYKREQNTDADVFFVDKGLVDQGVYSRMHRVREPETIVKHAKRRYKKVFFLEPAPEDPYTVLSKEERERLAKESEALKKEYQHNGYYIIDVPYMSVRQRTNFIVNNIHDKSIKARVKDTAARYERHISVIALLGGFIFDSLTLTRIDKLYDNIVVIIYLLLTGLGIFLVNLYESGRIKSKVFRFFHKVFPVVIQFAFGGLFSAFTLFYSRSSDLSGSWPFILILVGLLIGNEYLKRYYRRFTLQLSLLYFVLFSYLIFVLPIVLQKMNAIIFVISGLLSLVVIYNYIGLFKKYIPEAYKQSKAVVKTSISVIFILINIMYFTNYIPPIPLSLEDTGVYHNAFRNLSGDYVVEKELQHWFNRFIFNEVLHVSEGESLYVYSSVYAPVKLKTDIVHRWQKWDKDKREWVTKATIDFPVVGGRIEGYRGYSTSKVDSGSWRVSIENKRGQVIGRDNFTVEDRGILSTMELERVSVVLP